MLGMDRTCIDQLSGHVGAEVTLKGWLYNRRSSGKIHFLLLGGNQVNANALLRFYVLHCVVLPLAAILFIAVHFWRIRKDGGLYVQQSEPKPQAIAVGVPAAKEGK